MTHPTPDYATETAMNTDDEEQALITAFKGWADIKAGTPPSSQLGPALRDLNERLEAIELALTVR